MVLVSEDAFAVSGFCSVATRSPFFAQTLVGRLRSFDVFAGSEFRVFPPLFMANVIAVSGFLGFPLFLALPSINATSVSVS